LRIQLPKYHDNDDPTLYIQQLTKICVTNGENNHKIQYFPNSLKERVIDWFIRYEIAHPTTTWNWVQQALITRFSEILNEGQVVATLGYAQQKKSMEDYYDWFLWLCVVIPQQLDDIYFREAFREGLWTKVKMLIINMPWRTLAEVAKSAITMEEKLLVRWKNIARYHQANLDNE